MERWHYHYAGLIFRSELRIPEWDAFQVPGADEADVEILLEAEGAPLLPSAVLGVGTVRFPFPDAGEFLVQDGREIRLRPEPGAGGLAVRAGLLGPALGVLLNQLGSLALHASAVKAKDGVVLLCGPSGAGKSTLAAALADRGLPILSDDLCCLACPEGQDPKVHPGPPRIKLWQEALERLGLADLPRGRDHARLEKFHLTLAAAPPAEPLPLGRIVLLEWGPLGLETLGGLAAVRRLVAAATYQRWQLAPMGCLARHWEHCLRLAARVPIQAFRRPRDWDELGASVNFFLAQGLGELEWEQLGRGPQIWMD